MIKIENIEVWGFEHSIRGMRNPKNSWQRSDSSFGHEDDILNIGENDLKLMKTLYKGGSEHRKYLRQIFVSLDITAPLYWWKEFDTYKVGTVANSCSTMHKITAKEFTFDDFSIEHLLSDDPSGFDYNVPVHDPENRNKIVNGECVLTPLHLLKTTIDVLNVMRYRYLKAKNKAHWWQIIQLLPSSYNQKRTITMNYENVFNMIHQREHHKLDEWQEFTNILKDLPYVKEIGEIE